MLNTQCARFVPRVASLILKVWTHVPCALQEHLLLVWARWHAPAALSAHILTQLVAQSVKVARPNLVAVARSSKVRIRLVIASAWWAAMMVKNFMGLENVSLAARAWIAKRLG
jgi:hypothetical protein